MFKPRTFVVPLYGGDFQQRISQTEQRIGVLLDLIEKAAKREKSGQTPPRLLSDISEVEELAQQYDALVVKHDALVETAESESCTKVTLCALGRKRWNAMVAEHPPRTEESVPEETREKDAKIGVNDETFGEALLPESIESVSDGTPVSDLLENVSSAQYDLLYRAAFGLNRDGGPLPQLLTPPSQSGAETAS